MSLLEQSTNQQNYKNSFELLILGDVGQIEFFYKTHQKKKIPNEEVIKWEDKFIRNEDYFLNNFSCSVQTKDPINLKKQTFDLEKQEGLEIFNIIIENKQTQEKIKAADNVVILGDLVYVESKHLLVDKKLRSLDKWVNRLECGWNLFLRALEKSGLVKFKLDEKLNKGLLPSFNSKVDMLAGNHELDVDIYLQEKYYKNLESFSEEKDKLGIKAYNITKNYFGEEAKKEDVFTYTPVFITINFRDFKIEFLDFSTANLYCLHMKNEKDFNDCAIRNSYISYTEALDYGEKIIQGLKRFTQVEDDLRIWRVIRTHIGPLNPEDGDEMIYFNYIYLKSNTYLVIEEMKKARVNIILSAHAHYNAVMAYPYSRKFVDNRANPSCHDSSHTEKSNFGCYTLSDSNIFSSNLKFSKDCKDQISLILPMNYSDYQAENGILYQFQTGNSGRVADSLKSGKDINGFLIWSRTLKANDQFNYGFSVARFYKEKFEIEFFEVNKTQEDLIKAAEFTIQHGTIPKGDLLNKLVEDKCNTTSWSFSSQFSFFLLTVVLVSGSFFFYRYIKHWYNKNSETNFSKMSLI